MPDWATVCLRGLGTNPVRARARRAGNPTSAYRCSVAGLGPNNKVAARVRELQAQVAQSLMVFGTSPECPLVFAIGFQNGEVVD